jgi:hypothetical protein
METKQKREPLIFNAGTKGTGKTYQFERDLKNYFIIETGKRNRQDKDMKKIIQEAKINHEKICVKTHYNFLKNKYNSSLLTNTGVSYTLFIDDMFNNIPDKKSIKYKSNLKETEFYKKIKNIK